MAKQRDYSASEKGMAEGMASMLHIFCQTTPPDDKFAECVNGYCPTCKVDRKQTESGFLMCYVGPTLTLEDGSKGVLPVGPLLSFSQHLCCATCGATLQAPSAWQRPARKSGKRETRA